MEWGGGRVTVTVTDRRKRVGSIYPAALVYKDPICSAIGSLLVYPAVPGKEGMARGGVEPGDTVGHLYLVTPAGNVCVWRWWHIKP